MSDQLMQGVQYICHCKEYCTLVTYCKEYCTSVTCCKGYCTPVISMMLAVSD